jgi:pimeloyl-ACP methyl ester carboxylesterase
MTPETKYALSGDVNIAYQVVGGGSLDLVYVPGWVSNVELAWEDPASRRFLERLASFSRLILFDKRGTGLSDSVAEDQLPTLEQRMDDVRAVMDAVGLQRAAMFGWSEGVPMSALFAATYPERTSALVLYGAMPGASVPKIIPGHPRARNGKNFLMPFRKDGVVLLTSILLHQVRNTTSGFDSGGQPICAGAPAPGARSPWRV